MGGKQTDLVKVFYELRFPAAAEPLQTSEDIKYLFCCITAAEDLLEHKECCYV